MRQQPMLVTALALFVTLITVLRVPLVDHDGEETVEVNGNMMTWVSADGVRICVLQSSLPRDGGPMVIFGQGFSRDGLDFTAGGVEADVFRYDNTYWICPITAFN